MQTDRISAATPGAMARKAAHLQKDDIGELANLESRLLRLARLRFAVRVCRDLRAEVARQSSGRSSALM